MKQLSPATRARYFRRQLVDRIMSGLCIAAAGLIDMFVQRDRLLIERVITANHAVGLRGACATACAVIAFFWRTRNEEEQGEGRKRREP